MSDFEPLTGPELLALTAATWRTLGDYPTRADRRALVEGAPRLLVDLARERKRAEQAEAKLAALKADLEIWLHRTELAENVFNEIDAHNRLLAAIPHPTETAT